MEWFYSVVGKENKIIKPEKPAAKSVKLIPISHTDLSSYFNEQLVVNISLG